jgi:hypothetical protein
VTVSSSSSSFSALQPFTFGLGFPHNTHQSVLSKALVFHPFTPNFFKSNSISSIHLCPGLPYIFSLLLVGFPVISLLSFHCPFLHYAQAIPICVQQLQLQYREVYIYYKFTDSCLFFSGHFHMLAHTFFFPFSCHYGYLQFIL